MIDVTYTDTLPLHPQPERFESFSSHLMRIAEENCIDKLSALKKFLGVAMSNEEHFGDYPHYISETLLLRTACTKSQLLASTLYHVGKKFGRSMQPNALARFFNGGVGKSLRYCPCCLGEARYYLLPWQFLSLEGCPRHDCRLFDHCGHCGSPIPLFYLPAKVGVCPTCEKDLQSCSPERLSEQEVSRVSQRIADVEYLLSPLDEEQDNNIARMVGAKFRIFRQEKSHAIEDIADYLEMPVRAVKSLEQGTKDRSVYLQTYMRYAEYLDVTLQMILTAPLISHSKKKNNIPVRGGDITFLQLRQAKRVQREAELLDQIKQAIEELRVLGVPVTVTAISQHVHMDPSALKQYSAVKDMLRGVSDAARDERRKQRLQREEETFQEVQKAVAHFNALGQALSAQAISEYAQISVSRLYSYPRVSELLKQVLTKKIIQKQWETVDEQVIVDQVQKVICELRASGHILLQKTISSSVGISLHRLHSYPLVKTILQQVADERRLQGRVQSQLHGQEIVKRVQEAREQLRASNQPVSNKSVAELVGLSLKALYRYPEVKPLLAEIAEEYQQRCTERTLQREQDLLEQVRQAMQSLEECGRRITQQAIGDMVGYSDAGMLYYQEFRRLYRQVRDEFRQAREHQARQREELLLEHTENAIHELREQNMPVTLKNIGRMVGITGTALRKYPRIDELFQQLMNERREDSKKRARTH